MSERAKELAAKTVKDIIARKKKREKDISAYHAYKSDKTNVNKRGQR